MIELGVNSVLFGGFDFATAAKRIAASGYDGIEITAMKGLCDHLELDRWREQTKEIKKIVEDNGLKILSMEEGFLKEDKLIKAFEASTELGIPIVNIGPGGRSKVKGDFERQTDLIAKMAEKAESYNITLCVKIHIGQSIYNVATALKAAEKIKSSAFGINMDPSHIYRIGEDPIEALKQVSKWIKYIHIRDCSEKERGPGIPQNQTCGRGDIDLFGFCKVLVESGYNGSVCLEVIGANKLELAEVTTIAAESYGYLNACLKLLKDR